MKKVIVRIFIILFAASLIGASWYAYDTTSSDQTTLRDGKGEFAPDGEREKGHSSGAEGEGKSNSLIQLFRGAATIVGQTALVVAAVTLLRMLINKAGLIISKRKIASAPS